MKKIYLLLSAAIIGFANINAQSILNDDMESHSLGSYFSPIWTNWSLAPDPILNLQISDVQAASGTKSGFIGNTDQDVFLRFPTLQTSNTVTAEWKMYIPVGKIAYYNLQETRTPGESWGFQCYSNSFSDTFILGNGESMGQKMVWTTSVIDPETGDTSNIIYAYASIPYGEWFTLKQVLNMDDQTMSFYINGTEATYYYYADNRWPGLLGTAGGFNFYDADPTDGSADNAYYIDDVLVYTGALSISDNGFQKDMVSIFPNPVNNGILTITAKENIEHVEIFNVLGQRVLDLNPHNQVVEVKTGKLSAGIYTARISTKDNYTIEKIVIN